ncbi:ABC transporter substrate-binding protein [Arenibaculum pallidiluteum]|uniref:ABC transporter substrate-binding protein n=1 Tax=Arenibaculum pallidiluteum TaxID=2812559 RepID=UPI001A9657D8|nr:ABC transporter substrate-binding protein [Arenibaculum pallidiluteum]
MSLLRAAGALALSACAAPAVSGTGTAISGDAVRIGFITDLSGPYASVDGPAGAAAIEMAVADRGGTVAGRRVEVLAGDHENHPELAAAMARRWLTEEGVDVLISGVNTDTSLAMAEVARETRKPFLVVSAGGAEHTNEKCSPYTVQWAYDTTALSKVAGAAVTAAGGRSWYILTGDYPFGHELENETAAAVEAAGGTVLGTERHAHGATDFSAAIGRAQRSGAQVLGLASGHSTLVAAVRDANRLDPAKSMRIAGLLAFIDEVHELGLEQAQGMYHPDSWYWDCDEATRAWSQRFFARFDRMASLLHAGDYSAAFQYLAAVEAAGTDDGDGVMARLRGTTFNDVSLQNGRIRGYGLMEHDMYLLQVKSPAQSRGPWDYDTIVGTFRGDAAWRPKSRSKCASWTG